MNNTSKYWKNAELTNGRLAMMGLFALVINYGFFGWIIPGIFQYYLIFYASNLFLLFNMVQTDPTKNKLVKAKKNMDPLSSELYEELLKEYSRQLEI